MTTKKISVIIFIMLVWTVICYPGSIKINTDNLEDCIGISSFLSNTKGEIFLFSRRAHKIFKFTKNGDFVKSFCRHGVGPGDIKRVLFMFHNPTNDFLYLPEYYSGLGKVSIFDSEGNFKNYLELEIPITQKNHIKKLIFLDDGSFYAILDERVEWEPRGKIYVTKDKLSILFFDKDGKQKKEIYTTLEDNEVADRPNMGGPRILFLPYILIKKTPRGDICIGKTDDNLLHVYSKKGTKIRTFSLEMKKLLLSDHEFEKAKSELIPRLRNDPRMEWLAKRMIKLKYKPIYHNFFILPKYFVILEIKKETELGYTKESILRFFDKSGKQKSVKKVMGYVMNIVNNQLYIKEYDKDDNELFRIDSL